MSKQATSYGNFVDCIYCWYKGVTYNNFIMMLAGKCHVWFMYIQSEINICMCDGMEQKTLNEQGCIRIDKIINTECESI